MMQESLSIKGVICFTNPQQLPFIKQKGMYGNISDGDVPKNPRVGTSVTAARRIRFGKLKDLLCVAPGDYVFLFEREESRLHGCWKVSGEPFYCTLPDFDPSNNYPYRFYIQQHLNFPNPVPAMELRKLLNKNLLWSIRTFEREMAAPFASVNPISSKEVDVLLGLFAKYNHRFDPTSNLVQYSHPPLQSSVNFYDLVMNNIFSSGMPLQITAEDLGQFSHRVIYEEAMHCYFIYNLVRHNKPVRDLFGQYEQVLREVPISVAGQKRPDILLIYQNVITREPSVYSIMEVKRGGVNSGMLSQLLEYVRLFSERHSVDLNAVEGIYIGANFEPNALTYIRERAKVEIERAVRLMTYKLRGNSIELTEVV